jgi:hypothetical protein
LATGALAGALAAWPEVVLVELLSLLEQPASAAAAHSSTAQVGLPNTSHPSNLAELQAIVVSVVDYSLRC